jgi:hypothetical protein
MARMKTNQDGGSVTAKDPGAAAKELKKNEDSVAKMGYKQEFGGNRMSPSKMGDATASELMHGAAKYYDGAGQYMNGAPKYEGAGKHHGPMDAGHGEEPGHSHELEGFTGTATRKSPVGNQELLTQEQRDYDSNTTNVMRSLAQQDSINLANKGENFKAKLLYGQNYDYTKKLPGSNASEGRVTQYTAKERKKKYKSLRNQALNIQGPRPTQENRQFEL